MHGKLSTVSALLVCTGYEVFSRSWPAGEVFKQPMSTPVSGSKIAERGEHLMKCEYVNINCSVNGV